MKEVRRVSPELLAEAADWFIRVRAARADSGVHAAWLAWIETDPAHRAAFADVQRTWDIVGQVQSPPWPRPEELGGAPAAEPGPKSGKLRPGTAEAAATSDGPAQAARSPLAPASGRQRRVRGRRWFALAASVAASITALLLARFDIVSSWLDDSSGAHQRITTTRGGQQSAVLPDGSRIELGGLTGVEVAFTPERRLIVADEGEAFYKVERDPTRPFVVQAGPVSVTAVGTAFAVRREGGTVSVVVTEGVVEVNADSVRSAANAAAPTKAVRAKAGQRVRFDGGQLAPVALPVHVEPAVAWRSSQLRFEEEPLRVVVASLNRYSMRQIVIADPSLEELRFTGTVFDGDVEDWLKAAPVVFPVAVDETDPNRIVIGRRR